MDDIGLIFRALEFAAIRHKNQFRKGEDRPPYINHPIQVANLLVNEGGEKDPVLLAAAILHDVIEDTVDSESEKNELINKIKDLFGEEVLSVTLEVTDDKNLQKAERKRLQVEHAPTISINAKKLKLADKILNVRDITSNPPVGWNPERITGYFDWAEKVVTGLRGVNKKLEDMFDDVLAKARLKYTE
ncbi:MAG TPA: HD domain-containing protein [Bacteroidales bacterium]|nr:HD domain-containing protein [Bacteroidales bacterium]